MFALQSIEQNYANANFYSFLSVFLFTFLFIFHYSYKKAIHGKQGTG
ncbi:hypothetical protein GAGA_4573 [Paraglaciecola agarilytica NO2]|uniref:Uncharacterized protein n=1 Tax=Paraglaciecola agarilytica NO2 TaxID=1125747 RepID=A0ABQ0IDP4_9ALTE|nr:hypothetical protein GAGA_4573 [Paraglaciecola agarilytica NO2]